MTVKKGIGPVPALAAMLDKKCCFRYNTGIVNILEEVCPFIGEMYWEAHEPKRILPADLPVGKCNFINLGFERE
ncbi:MAG: hypothetical protein UFJ18_00500 [Blautia sp.]|nr:hypothetical protein [Blautia sp.]